MLFNREYCILSRLQSANLITEKNKNYFTPHLRPYYAGVLNTF